MTPRPAVPTKNTPGVYITNKITRMSKNNTPYLMLESTVGTLVVFDEQLGERLEPSNDIAYTLALAEPTGTFKHRNVKGILGTEKKPMPAPEKPAAPVHDSAANHYKEAAPRQERAYGGARPDAEVFEAKDLRISKLSVFSSIVNLTAAKAKADPEFAKKSLEEMLLDAVACASMVTTEFIYGVTKASGISSAAAPVTQPAQPVAPAPVPAPAPQVATPQVQTPTPPPATPYAPPAPVPPVYRTDPAAVPPTVTYPQQPAPVAAAAPYVPPAGQNGPAQQAADAQKLFGIGSDLETRMAERLKALTSKAQR